jgi:hypothetical protein
MDTSKLYSVEEIWDLGDGHCYLDAERLARLAQTN